MNEQQKAELNLRRTRDVNRAFEVRSSLRGKEDTEEYRIADEALKKAMKAYHKDVSGIDYDSSEHKESLRCHAAVMAIMKTHKK